MNTVPDDISVVCAAVVAIAIGGGLVAGRRPLARMMYQLRAEVRSSLGVNSEISEAVLAAVITFAGCGCIAIGALGAILAVRALIIGQ
jgi:hypothetical protein